MKRFILLILITLSTAFLSSQEKAAIAIINETSDIANDQLIAINEAIEIRCRNLLASMEKYSITPIETVISKEEAKTRGLDNIILYNTSIENFVVHINIEAWDVHNDKILNSQSAETSDYLKVFNLTQELIHPIAETLYGSHITYGIIEFRTEGLPGWYVELNGERLDPSQSKMELITGMHEVKVLSEKQELLNQQTIDLQEGDKQIILIVNTEIASAEKEQEPVLGDLLYSPIEENHRFLKKQYLFEGTLFTQKKQPNYLSLVDEIQYKISDDSILQSMGERYTLQIRRNKMWAWGGFSLFALGVVSNFVLWNEEGDLNFPAMENYISNDGAHGLSLITGIAGLSIMVPNYINSKRAPIDFIDYYNRTYTVKK